MYHVCIIYISYEYFNLMNNAGVYYVYARATPDRSHDIHYIMYAHNIIVGTDDMYNIPTTYE